ncbi:hypothetical protein OS493_013904 [Desmophyllum pertusum]|uniref:Uncharacterized protein n=1 Tax=Desmophyllum pertusum TaxID=174260 RepID=A0A9W9ZRZ2_9CNID|nr:hypothetical protein OS493_013904 [Desmophyllum pertusum]
MADNSDDSDASSPDNSDVDDMPTGPVPCGEKRKKPDVWNEAKTNAAFVLPAEINGGYSPWGEWSTCSDTCGNGVQIRSRSCTAPPQRKGGKDCSRFGPSEETKTCNVTPCATGF